MKKHPRNKPDPRWCNEEDDGYYCVLAKKHVEDHEAWGGKEGNTLLHSWPQKPKVL